MIAVHASPPRANRPDYLFTAESVSAGHPDKLADRLADIILDRFLADDPTARVACECLVSGDLVVVAGEVSTSSSLFARVHDEIPGLVRQLLTDTGYDTTFPGIDPERVEIRVTLQAQSADIRRGVDRPDGTLGAGDQGMMFGYACDETPELMPLPLILAHRLVQRQDDMRCSGELPWLRPDAKSQVTVRYRGDRPVAVETVVLSTQHDAAVPIGTLRSQVEQQIVRAIIPEALLAPACRILINPTGRFVVGGPRGDTGLTGRKIIIDTYGGSCPHGGGAFSGKDPSKVDRSGAYAARYVAKNIVAAGLARRCTVQLAYAIGEPAPVSVMIDTHATGIVPEDVLEAAVAEEFDLTPAGIIAMLDLCRPIYHDTAAYGHFGRADRSFPWELTDRAGRLRHRCIPGKN